MMIIHFESCFSFYHWCDLLQRTTASNSWACLAFENSANFGTKRVIFAKGFKLNCLVDKVMAPSLVNDAVDCFAKGEILDPNISILVMNFENESDPFGAISNPLYQTTTFKQPNAIENGPYDYTRSEKSHSRCFRKVHCVLLVVFSGFNFGEQF
ncbi:hypothetical protein HN51_032084 [Arachis hypogaea]